MRRIISKVVQKLFGRRRAAADREQHAARGAHPHPAPQPHPHRAPHQAPPAAVVVAREQHSLSRSRIDEDALKVLTRLVRNNHAAFLVGGGVRDLLLNRPVKDFDIATSAHPHEIKALFRNCRLIGRRFRLAHVLFRGGKVIEVSTFRKHAGFSDEGDLLIKSDNAFGTAEEDALRRDFTINGLFYSIADFSVIDYVGGLADLERRLIRTIGDPNIRLREDPIRTLRGIRFAARLDFQIEAATRRAMTAHREEIWKCAAPRIVDEFVRMLNQGAAAKSFPLLAELDMLGGLLPAFAKAHRVPAIREAVQRNLASLDALQKPQGGLAAGLSLAALYQPLFADALAGAPPGSDPVKIAAELLEPELGRLKFPRAQLEKAVLLLGSQQRLTQPRRRRARGGPLAAKPWFAEALTLFEITQAWTPEGKAALRRLRDQLRHATEGRAGADADAGEVDEPRAEGEPGPEGAEPIEPGAAERPGAGRRRRRSRRGRGRGRGRGQRTESGLERSPGAEQASPAAEQHPGPQVRQRPSAPAPRQDDPDDDRPIDPDAAFGDGDGGGDDEGLEAPGAPAPESRTD